MTQTITITGISAAAVVAINKANLRADGLNVEIADSTVDDALSLTITLSHEDGDRAAKRLAHIFEHLVNPLRSS